MRMAKKVCLKDIVKLLRPYKRFVIFLIFRFYKKLNKSLNLIDSSAEKMYFWL
jgi:hypothetical protein